MNPRLAFNLLTDRLAALPLAILYLTDRCNSRCVMCDYWQHGQTNFPAARAEPLAHELKALGTQVILLSGGEPLLHPHWAEVAQTLRAVSGARLWLLTAGLSLTKHVAQVAELCACLTVSVDSATAETYHAIRGVDAFDVVCAGIRAAVERGLPVTLRCTVQRSNYTQLPALIRLARQLGVAQISFLAVDVRTRVAFARHSAPDQTPTLTPTDLPLFDAVLASVSHDFESDFASGFIAESPDKLRRLHRYFAALVGQGEFPPVRCNAPRFSAVIGADGRLQPCYFIQPSGAGVQPMALNLNTPEQLAVRRAIRLQQRPECHTCVCSLYRGPQALLFSEF